MIVGLITAPTKLTAIIELEIVFLLQTMADADDEACLFQITRRVEFYVGKGVKFAFGDVPFGLQTAAQHVLTLAFYLIVFPLSLVKVKVVDDF